jgi:putative nucleotidyltransferase with HDIG domain
VQAAPPSLRRVSALTVFISVVIGAGLAAIGHSVYLLGEAPNPFGWIALGGLAILTASFALKVPGVPVYLSISDAFFIASALLFGPGPATLTIAIDSFVVSLRRRNEIRQLLFNTTSSALALWAGAQTYYWLLRSNSASSLGASPEAMIAPLGLLAAVYFVLNSGLTAVAVSLSKGVSAFRLWREHFALMSLNYFAAASAAFVFIVLVHYVGGPALAAVVPLILVCHLAMRSWLGRIDDAQRHLVRVNQLYRSTVSAFSTAIEAKDGVTSEHIHRVQAYAIGLARALNVTEPATLQAIEAAALLHDTGKLAIPEHILNKPAKLTPTEFDTMKTHVSVGAEILAAIDFPFPVVPIVFAHHENWDGTGYPNGLKGEQIPIGARILSVVDCFDALTSDRPYRRAMSQEEALSIILERRGTMYDPAVVDAFIRVYRDIEVPEAEPQLQALMHNVRRGVSRPAAEQPTVAAAVPTIHASSSDDLLGFVSLARLTCGSPTMRDIGVVAWSQMRQLTPRATMAMFVLDESKTSLSLVHVAGQAANRLPPSLTFAIGERISGWVAATRRSVADTDAALDLGKGLDDVLRFASSTPLVGDRGVIGVLTLYGLEPFGEQLMLTMEMIGPHLARVMTAARAADVAHPATGSGESDVRAKRYAGLSLVSRR